MYRITRGRNGDDFVDVRRGVKRFGPLLEASALAKRAAIGGIGSQIQQRVNAGRQHSLGSGLTRSSAQQQLSQYTYDFDALDPDSLMPMVSAANVNPRIVVNCIANNLVALVTQNSTLMMPISQDVTFVMRDVDSRDRTNGDNHTRRINSMLRHPARAMSGGSTTDAVLAADVVALNAIMFLQQKKWYESDKDAYDYYINAANLWFGFNDDEERVAGIFSSHTGYTLAGIMRACDTNAKHNTGGAAATLAMFGQTEVTNVWDTTGLAAGARVMFVLMRCSADMMETEQTQSLLLGGSREDPLKKTIRYELRSRRLDDDYKMTTTTHPIEWPEEDDYYKFLPYQLVPFVVPMGSTVKRILELRDLSDEMRLDYGDDVLVLSVGTVVSVHRHLKTMAEQHGTPHTWKPRPSQVSKNHVDESSLLTVVADVDDGLYHYQGIAKHGDV